MSHKGCLSFSLINKESWAIFMFCLSFCFTFCKHVLFCFWNLLRHHQRKIRLKGWLSGVWSPLNKERAITLLEAKKIILNIFNIVSFKFESYLNLRMVFSWAWMYRFLKLQSIKCYYVYIWFCSLDYLKWQQKMQTKMLKKLPFGPFEYSYTIQNAKG